MMKLFAISSLSIRVIFKVDAILPDRKGLTVFQKVVTNTPYI